MLSDSKIKSLKPSEKTYRISDHEGLCIEIKPTGVKLWRYRYRFLGKASMLGLGEYPELSLAEARKLKDEMKALLKAGTDPAQHRKDQKQKAIYKNANKNTFEILASEYKERRLSHKSEKYLAQYDSRMKIDIFPQIGKKDVKDVTSADVLKIIENTIKRVTSQKNHGTGEVTAILNRQFISAVMCYAVSTLRAEYDPTYAVRKVIERPDIEHARPLNKPEQIQLRTKLENYKGSETVRNAGLTMMYTMLRTIEIRRMKWEHIDFDERIITFSATSRKNKTERVMKKNRTHIVPMSDQVHDLLMHQKKNYESREYVFPAIYQDGMLSPATLNRMLEYIGLVNVTGHDFRATASTLLNEKGYDSDWIEKQLAHSDDDKTRASYNHARYLDDRRKMMQDWADIVDSWVE